MSTRTATRTSRATSVQAEDAAKVETAVTEALTKVTPYDRLVEALLLIGKETAKPVDDPSTIKWGKAVGLRGGGSVYVNRSNVDVRSTQKQVADWAKEIVPSVVRGPQGQYLRITF